jgi:two-component system, chemotaxis family, CheB/CheR fusion protein
MFMQAEVAIERSGTGLGIGLALVKSLVELHGGTVEAHSAGVGHGSEFVVRLPITHEAPQLRPITPPHEKFATMTARRVLVVDDNQDAAESLAMFLKLTGHDTHIAHDGLEAVEKAEQQVSVAVSLPRLVSVTRGCLTHNSPQTGQRDGPHC